MTAALRSAPLAITATKRKRSVSARFFVLGLWCFIAGSCPLPVSSFASLPMQYDGYKAHTKSARDTLLPTTPGLLPSTRPDAVSRKASQVVDTDSRISVSSGRGGPSVRSRVKEFILSQRRKLKNRTQPAVVEVEDMDIFRYLLGQERNSYTAVMFHAPFCKACKASLPLFERVAQRYKNHQNKRISESPLHQGAEEEQVPQRIKFLSVTITKANAQFLQDVFGVTKFPLAQIYHPQDGLVDERPILRKLFPRFEQQIQSFVGSS